MTEQFLLFIYCRFSFLFVLSIEKNGMRNRLSSKNYTIVSHQFFACFICLLPFVLRFSFCQPFVHINRHKSSRKLLFPANNLSLTSINAKLIVVVTFNLVLYIADIFSKVEYDIFLSIEAFVTFVLVRDFSSYRWRWSSFDLKLPLNCFSIFYICHIKIILKIFTQTHARLFEPMTNSIWMQRENAELTSIYDYEKCICWTRDSFLSKLLRFAKQQHKMWRKKRIVLFLSDSNYNYPYQRFTFSFFCRSIIVLQL